MLRSERGAARRAGIAVGVVGILLTSAGTSQAAEIDATWNGGAGTLIQPNWTFSQPPSSGLAFPRNDGTDFYTVLLPGSAPASDLTIGGPIPLDRVETGSGATLRLDGGSVTLESDPGRVGSGELFNAGQILLDGGINGLRLDNPGAVTVTGTSGLLMERIDNGGLLEVAAPASLAIPMIFDFNPDLNRPSEISNTGSLRVFGELSAQSELFNDGVFEVLGGDAEVSTFFQDAPGAITRVSDGGQLTVSFRFESSSGFLVQQGVVQLDGGTLSVFEGPFLPGGVGIIGSGVLEGSGTVIEDLTDDPFAVAGGGTLRPGIGDGIGQLDIVGELFLGGIFDVDLAASGGDLVTVTGVAELSGDVVVELEAGYDPALGEIFDVLAAGEILDSGFDVLLPLLSGGKSWRDEIVTLPDTTDVLRLTVVPEPGTASLLLLGLGFLTLGRVRPR